MARAKKLQKVSWDEQAFSENEIIPQTVSPSSPQQLMGEAIEHLQGRQREVYILTMREDKSLSEAGEILAISKDSVRTYLDRAIAFISAYCQQGIDQGRI